MDNFAGISSRIRVLLIVAAGLAGCAAEQPVVDGGSSGSAQVTNLTKPGAKVAGKVVYIHTRPGVLQGFLLLAPEKPVASAILFAGGNGRIRLQRDGQLASTNFLVRTRELFVRRGIAVAVVDTASDIRSLKSVEMRFSERHQKDIEAVIVYLKKSLKRPVWLVGTSNGTLSAASIAASSNAPIDGLVLTSSMTEVTEADLANVRVPAMVVANRNDVCRVTPPDYAESIAKALATKAVYFESSGATSRACGALSEHGFLGIEEKVVDAIVRFIRRW